MNIFILLVLIIITILIYFISDRALLIANSYENLDVLIANIFKILRERQNYIKESYPNLEIEEFYNQIKHQTDLKKRLDLEFSFDFDDKSNEYLEEAKNAIFNYNKAINEQEVLLSKHPMLTKIYRYNKYKRL